MVELLGVLLALLIVWLVWLLLRLARWLRRGLRLLLGARGGTRGGARGINRLAALRGVRLRTARAVAQAQAERIAALAGELDRTRRALQLAEAARGRGGPPEDRFRRAKQSFAVLFHPDRLRCGEPERSLRIGIFSQFWQVLRRIERS